MRPLLLTAPLLLVALALDLPPAGARPPARPVEEAFTTADGVRLKGLFHRSPVGDRQGDAVVVLLYPPGPDRDMRGGNWDGLVGRLNEAGFHVFRFDWRGHGRSTDIVDPLGDGTPFSGFWTNAVTGAWNRRYVRGFNRRPVKNELRVTADVNHSRYFPVYVNDLAAVRLHLDQKNDNGVGNTSSIYLVGAGDTATLGMMWLAAEWARPAVAPVLPNGLQYKSVPQSTLVSPDPPAGADVAGAVWLSADRPAGVPEGTVRAWARSAPKLRDNNKMLFVYGADDGDAERDAGAFFHKVLVAGGSRELPPVEQTFLFPVAGTRLNGIDLLGQYGRRVDPLPEETVLEYLAARQKDRVTMVRKTRNYVTPYYVDMNYFLGLR
jgi:pimeloyl-ACP methyl ester carboxylesterase